MQSYLALAILLSVVPIQNAKPVVEKSGFADFSPPHRPIALKWEDTIYQYDPFSGPPPNELPEPSIKQEVLDKCDASTINLATQEILMDLKKTKSENVSDKREAIKRFTKAFDQKMEARNDLYYLYRMHMTHIQNQNLIDGFNRPSTTIKQIVKQLTRVIDALKMGCQTIDRHFHFVEGKHRFSEEIAHIKIKDSYLINRDNLESNGEKINDLKNIHRLLHEEVKLLNHIRSQKNYRENNTGRALLPIKLPADTIGVCEEFLVDEAKGPSKTI